MYGVTTNYASTAALRNLQSINSQLQQTQGRISSGLKVASAKDGAAAWSAATTIRSEISTNESLSAGLSYYKSAAATAATAAESIVGALNTMKTALTSYQNSTDDTEKSALMTKITGAQNTITAALAASKTGETDWLASTDKISFNVGVDSAGAFIKSEYQIAANLSTVLTDTDIKATDFAKNITDFGQSDLDVAGNIALILTALDDASTGAIGKVTTFAANVGALSEQIESQQTFLKTISDIKSSALSSLVDANMEEESTRLSALQVQQQLATQALQISNASSQNILRLFQ
ncbi:flagellin [Consotaella salsifontis]|uniref:Flagellin n=1 Tax=Consotaella salsifontis TaxID=1365950 RepID=A0A1T4NRC0_9HYPH|nr:flagellin [Consotaella salsifontis]SJZ81841.1 flagellin [Consotaella salsifontis]